MVSTTSANAKKTARCLDWCKGAGAVTSAAPGKLIIRRFLDLTTGSRYVDFGLAVLLARPSGTPQTPSSHKLRRSQFAAGPGEVFRAPAAVSG